MAHCSSFMRINEVQNMNYTLYMISVANNKKSEDEDFGNRIKFSN